MLPNKLEWKSWSAIEKASYVAQLLAPFSLLVTVIFSYLAWTESRHSFELQKTIFQAQNAPEISVKTIRMVQPGKAAVMLIPIKNVGNSVAKNICVSLYKIGDKTPFNRSCDSDRPFVGMSLQNGQDFELPLESAIHLEKEIGFTPSDIHIYKVGDKSAKCSSVAFKSIILHIEYMDALKNEYSMPYTLLVCK
jgi:hypothetical protein